MTVAQTTQAALLHRIATEQATHRLPSVAAGVVRGGELVWTGAVGSLTGRRGGPAPTPQTPYRIGSITKTFVAVEVLRLRDEGLLDLGDRIGEHLPEVPFGQVTIAQLLSHTSGLQAETAGPWWERTPGGSFADLLAGGVGLIFTPGTRFHYSNLGYGVLGELIARLRGASWHEAIRTELLEPLGMGATRLRAEADSAPGWGVHPQADLLHGEPEHDAVAMAPAGQFWSPVADLARWAAFLGGCTDGLLSAETLAEMVRPVAVVDNPTLPWHAAHALGWQVWNVDGRRYVGHGGSMPGFLAGLTVDLESGDGCVAFTNATSGMSNLSLALLDVLREAEPAPVEPWYADDAQAERLDLVGEWHWGTTTYVMRAATDGLLVLGAPGVRRGSRFRPEDTAGDGSWIGMDGYFEHERLRVVRRPDGTPSHLDIGSFRLTRTPYDPSADIPGGTDGGPWA